MISLSFQGHQWSVQGLNLNSSNAEVVLPISKWQLHRRTLHQPSLLLPPCSCPFLPSSSWLLVPTCYFWSWSWSSDSACWPMAFVPTAVRAKRGLCQMCVNVVWPVQSHVTVPSLPQLAVLMTVAAALMVGRGGLAPIAPPSPAGVRSVTVPVPTSLRTVRASIAFALRSS